MYSLLLVDDEKLELETLRDYVDWNELGIGTIYTALNGKEAYSKVMEYQPDIMITDIHMPVMNGVELVKKLYEEQVTTKIIFLTGYDDFEFIKVAFSVEAIDYILKPFTIEVINSAIGKVIQVLDKEQVLNQSVKVLEKKLLQSVISCEEEVRNPALEQFKKLKKDQPELLQYGLVQAVGNTESIDTESLENKFAEIAYAVKEEGRITFFILYFVNFLDSAKRIEKYYETAEIPALFLYSAQKHKIEDLYLEYEKFITCNNLLFYEDTYAIKEVSRLLNPDTQENLPVEPQNTILHKEYYKKLKDILQKPRADSNLERILELSKEYFKEIKVNRQERNFVMEEAAFLLTHIYDTYVEDNIALKEGLPLRGQIINSIYQVINEEELESIFFNYLDYILEYQGRNSRDYKDKNEYIVQCVKNYIITNYANIITIESIAEEIGLSPNYVRNIFKEKTGITLTEWITDYRLEEACNLLKDDKLKIKQISFMVGYENISYFCSVFAKKYGLSPNEYRNRYIH
ncbi:response regulator [Anaerocolumna sedimenticola]|uniref:Stage 0 sporulation protein A homolog n=1 Tax=Anaerocolumna sedimenticola TaxID=2696063 RepID=A0A6P1TL23_9FIRM|nr:response regulator [Anaerocolumna sedimenticola]QHQ60335.1 response regulator [Anaerocolumna sedimenticola]